MSIENIKKLIASKKETFFDKSEGGLLNQIAKEKSELINSFTDALLLTFIPSISSCVLGFTLFNLLGNEGLGILTGFLSFPVLSFIIYISMPKRNKKIILKNLEKNSDFKREFFDSYILPYFMKRKIDSEMADTLKLNLSLDQYKALKFQSSSNISYGDVYKFIANIDNTNKTIKEIEAEKYSVEYDNIKKEIHLV